MVAKDRWVAIAMRRARFRLRVNEEILEADIVVGTKAQWESSLLVATPGWSINVQGNRIVAMRFSSGRVTFRRISPTT